MDLSKFRVKIFGDGADITAIRELAANPLVAGFTTNPSLMRKAGVENYEAFAHEVLAVAENRPVSFEVLADDFANMERQARQIAAWGENVYVKIPITNTAGESCVPLLQTLAPDIQLNVTAIMLTAQVEQVLPALRGRAAFVSIFAGRIADTGRNPAMAVADALCVVRDQPNVEIIWASSREIWNVYQAEAIGCHAITVFPAMLAKLPWGGRDLAEYSLETVKQFTQDARESNYTVEG